MMKRLIILVVLVMFMFPAAALAQKIAVVDEYGEDVGADVVEQVAPAPEAKPKSASRIVEKNVGTGDSGKAAKKDGKSDTSVKDAQMPAQSAPSFDLGPTAGGREGKFRAGLLVPGIGVASQGVGALGVFGLEGEYFFYEKLSAGMLAELSTKFTRAAIVSFVPFVRYIFDFEGHPRWAAYVQAGAGVTAYRYAGSTNAAADIAIPGGGFWWQWTDKFSVGADNSLHIFVQSGQTTVGYVFAPAFRYLY